MGAYLDANPIVPLFVSEQNSAAMLAFTLHRDDLVVSDVAALEVASTIARLARTGELTRPAAAALAEFDAWRADFTAGEALGPADVAFADRCVRLFALMLKAPDALHVAIAARRTDTLVTYDARLRTAAQAVGVAVLSPA